MITRENLNLCDVTHVVEQLQNTPVKKGLASTRPGPLVPG